MMTIPQRILTEIAHAKQQLMMADNLEQKYAWDTKLSRLENELDDYIGVGIDDGDLMHYKPEDVV